MVGRRVPLPLVWINTNDVSFLPPPPCRRSGRMWRIVSFSRGLINTIPVIVLSPSWREFLDSTDRGGDWLPGSGNSFAIIFFSYVYLPLFRPFPVSVNRPIPRETSSSFPLIKFGHDSREGVLTSFVFAVETGFNSTAMLIRNRYSIINSGKILGRITGSNIS